MIDLPSVKDLLKDAPSGNSDFQTDNFVVRKVGGPTLWGQYKQALRELHVRYTSVVEYYFDLKDELLDMEEQELEAARLREDAGMSRDALADIRARKAENKLERTKVMVAMSKDEFIKGQGEFIRYYAHCALLRDKLVHEHGELTGEVKKQLEEDYWANDAYETVAKLTLGGQEADHVAREALAKMPHFPTRMREDLLDAVRTRRDVIAEAYKNRPRDLVREEELEGLLAALPSAVQLLEETMRVELECGNGTKGRLI